MVILTCNGLHSCICTNTLSTSLQTSSVMTSCVSSVKDEEGGASGSVPKRLRPPGCCEQHWQTLTDWLSLTELTWRHSCVSAQPICQTSFLFYTLQVWCVNVFNVVCVLVWHNSWTVLEITFWTDLWIRRQQSSWTMTFNVLLSDMWLLAHEHETEHHKEMMILLINLTG